MKQIKYDEVTLVSSKYYTTGVDGVLAIYFISKDVLLVETKDCYYHIPKTNILYLLEYKK